jgi:drug/metabolite transporter (DMT)-like permease
MPRAPSASLMPSSTRRSDLVRAVLWMTGALLSFSAMAVSVRTLSGSLKVMEILAIRNGGGLLILLGSGAFNPALLRTISVRRLPLHLMRCTIHFAGQFLWATGVTLLPLATVFALEFTAPTYTVVLSALFLSERLTLGRIAMVVCGLLGVLVILRPGLDSFRPAALIVLGAAFAFAIQLIQTKALTRTESAYAIVFWMNVVQLPLALAGSEPRAFVALGVADLLPIGAMALSGLMSHFCVAQAFRYGDAGFVVPMDFMRVPLIAVAGWWLYGERLDVFVFLGAGVIVSGIVSNLRAEAAGKSARSD